jgi:hypothetical protein
MAPAYEKVAEHYHRSTNSPVRVAKIDGTANPGLASPFDIKGYPTLIMLQDGEKVAEFNGPRTVEGIKEFVEETMRKPSANAPSMPRVARGSAATTGSRHPGRGEGLTKWLLQMAHDVGDLDPIQAALCMLVIAVACGCAAIPFYPARSHSNCPWPSI